MQVELKKRQKEHRKAIEHAGIPAGLHMHAWQALKVLCKEMDRVNNLAAHTELVQLSTRLKASLTQRALSKSGAPRQRVKDRERGRHVLQASFVLERL